MTPMLDLLEPLRSTSLKEVFIERFEDLILSGQLPIGATLPSERALALRLGASRAVVHEGLVELAARGLVTVKPRVGTVVNDYRREGSLALLGSLINHGGGALAPSLLEGLLSLRQLLQGEAVRQAARHRGDNELAELREVITGEQLVDRNDLEAVVEVDFAFHHSVALASGNPILPMLIKSFEPAEKNFAAEFFAADNVVDPVFDLHRRIVEAIGDHDEEEGAELMKELLVHGQEVLTAVLEKLETVATET